MLGSMMGSHNIWQGGSLAEVHTGARKSNKVRRFKIPKQLR